MKYLKFYDFISFVYKKIPAFFYIKNIFNLPTPTIRVPVNWEGIKFNFYAPIPIALKARNKGVESSLLRSCKKLIDHNKLSTVVDVGANFGFLSLVFSYYVKKFNGKVYSFEPHPQIFTTFMKTIKSNKLKNIIVENYAVGDIPTDITINISNYTSNVLDLFNGGAKTKRIKQVSLDQYFLDNNFPDLRVDFIKIDVDGYEYEVLLGCKKIIQTYHPVLVVELNNDNRVINFLKENGYILLNTKFEIENELVNKNIICLYNLNMIP